MRLAKIIAVLFHPVFLLPYLLLFFLAHEPSLILQGIERKFLLFIAFFVFTTVLPILSMYIFYATRIINSIELPQRKDRHLPYFTAVLYYAALCHLLYRLPLPFIYPASAAAGFGVLLIVFLVNLKIKISAHAAGAGGVLGILIFYILFIGESKSVLLMLAPAFFISGLIGFSRLQLKAHVPHQVYGGYFAGLFSAMISIWIFALFF